jgi:hypothetical protein
MTELLDQLRRDLCAAHHAWREAEDARTAALHRLHDVLFSDVQDQVGRVLVITEARRQVQILRFAWTTNFGDNHYPRGAYIMPIVVGQKKDGEWGKKEETLRDRWFDHDAREWRQD